jgi:NADPH:quinone reductase-like Zn-dependent oxidoreductase
MNAVVLTAFGHPEVLGLADVERPWPRKREILVRVRAASVGFGDLLVRDFAAVSPRKFHMPWLFWLIGKLTFGFKRPRVRILGSEFAGEVEAVGRLVTGFKEGDQVFGYCGPRMGAYAEYLRLAENAVVTTKPANMTYEQAAACPYGAIMALGLLRKIRLQPGQSVLVVGASGGIGPAVVRLARYQFGARVAGVCGPASLEYVRSLGADPVIDYTGEDFADRPETYDVVIDIPGKTSFAHCRRVLKPRGRLVCFSFKMKQVLQMLGTSIIGRRRVVCSLVAEKQRDLVTARELLEAGTLQSIVDRTFPLEQAAEAHRYAESGARKGPVVISLDPGE